MQLETPSRDKYFGMVLPAAALGTFSTLMYPPVVGITLQEQPMHHQGHEQCFHNLEGHPNKCQYRFLHAGAIVLQDLVIKVQK